VKLDLKTSVQNDVLIVSATGDRIDAAGAIQFKEQMRVICDGPQQTVLLDLSRVNFLDSSGLGAVVAVMKLLGPGRRLELASLSATVAKVFRLTRMDTVFLIHDSVPYGLPSAV
jgi:anti-sigma B factor antagonist